MRSTPCYKVIKVLSLFAAKREIRSRWGARIWVQGVLTRVSWLVLSFLKVRFFTHLPLCVSVLEFSMEHRDHWVDTIYAIIHLYWIYMYINYNRRGQQSSIEDWNHTGGVRFSYTFSKTYLWKSDTKEKRTKMCKYHQYLVMKKKLIQKRLYAITNITHNGHYWLQ